MRQPLSALAGIALCLCSSSALAASDVGCVDTAFQLLGANHKVCVEAIDDPEVPGVACHLSYAKTGGLKGSVGLAEDPSRFSLACRQIGPIPAAALAKIARDPKPALAFKKSSSLLFKHTRIYRMYDPARRSIVYLAISDRLIDGSPDNSISTVPLGSPTPSAPTPLRGAAHPE